MLRALALALLLALPSAGSAFAHATLLKAEPADGSTLAEAPAAFVLTFNEPVSPIALRLIEPDGSGRDLAGAVARDAVVSIPAPPLAKGTHALSWRVISADGHPVGGSVVFSVGSISAMEMADVRAPRGARRRDLAGAPGALPRPVRRSRRRVFRGVDRDRTAARGGPRASSTSPWRPALWRPSPRSACRAST